MLGSSHVELLGCWERAREQSDVDRAMTMLGAAHPESTPEELSALPLGERDARLLALRAALFGTSLRSVASCPSCATQLEFALDTRELIGSHGSREPCAPLPLTVGDLSLRLRPVNSRDLAAIVGSRDVHDVQSGRRLLCQRCIVEARRDGAPVAALDLTEEVMREVAGALVAADPRAEFLIDLACEACAHRCSLPLDVVSFLWTEIDARARTLLREVHALAWAYGWREADILALSDARRLFYLEMVS